MLAHLLDEARTRHITMHGLDADAVTALVEEATAGAPGPALLAAVTRAAGNPLFISELLHALDEEAHCTSSMDAVK